MPIVLDCPNGHPLRVKDKLAGKRGSCPKCGAPFDVPVVAAPARMATPPEPTNPGIQAGESGFVPPPPADADAVEWRLALPDGRQFGPTVPMVFGQWIAAGRVPEDALVWRTGWAEWKRAGEARPDLPARLPDEPEAPAAPPVAGAPPGATLPPESPAAPRAAESTSPAAGKKPASGAAYKLRRQRLARRRRLVVGALAVACLLLGVMLVWLMASGPPAAAPVVR